MGKRICLGILGLLFLIIENAFLFTNEENAIGDLKKKKKGHRIIQNIFSRAILSYRKRMVQAPL